MNSANTYNVILSLARKSEPLTRLALGSKLYKTNGYPDTWYFVKKNGSVQYAYFVRTHTLYIVWPKAIQAVAEDPMPIAYLREKAAICNAFTTLLETNLLRVEYVVRL